MEDLKNWLESAKTDDKSVVILLIKGYFILTILCFLCLLLPFCQNSESSVVDHLFYAVSLVSTTGLAPTNFSESYNFLGQLLSLFFIQLGGIGYMALSSFIILKQFKRLPGLSAKLLRLEFNLPERYPLMAFIYSVFGFTVLLESLGAVFLYFGFRSEGIENPLWNAVFHSISAFCTAGFSLFGDSMTSFSGNSLITTTILILSLLGSIGFIVLLDVWMKITRKRKKLTLTTKIIVISTFTLWILAAIFIFLSDHTLFNSGYEGMKIAIFQSISAHTTVGFNNYDLSEISVAGVFMMILLMIIGASPAGTGGGIKTTSVTALTSVLTSILKRRKHVTFLDKELPASKIYLAVSSTVFYSIILVLGTWLMLLADGDKFTLDKILFETASALSTVGLSTGITGELSDLSKMIIAGLMFVGRLGVLTFGLALISKAPLLRNKPEVEDIAI